MHANVLEADNASYFDTERFRRELETRVKEFGLRLSEEKTRLIELGKKSGQNGEMGPAEQLRTFDFLGFVHYMRRKGKR